MLVVFGAGTRFRADREEGVGNGSGLLSENSL